MNHHAGRLGDVWKHLVLAEVVRAERPERYAETHAGHAVNPLPDDPERRYGIRHAAAAFHRPSAYLDIARRYLVDSAYPGSAAIALSIRPEADALLADTDPESVADLRAWTARSAATHTRVVTADGPAALGPWLAEGRALVHVDPFDAAEVLEFAADVVTAGHGLVFWYGYDHPDDRAWPLAELGLPDLWAGDLLVTTADGSVEDDGDLGEATTPGTGCGVVLAGVDPTLGRRCEALGDALVAAYDGTPLPDGTPGALDLLVDIS
ncbi:hypothetical protein ACXR2U_23070 [Jatrophihabitans sp. YIM 134969]